jgi:hypothetical protein
VSTISNRFYRHISQFVCHWNVKFSQELAVGSPFAERGFVSGKNAMTMARDILARDQEQFGAAFRKSAIKRTKLAELAELAECRRNAEPVLANRLEHWIPDMSPTILRERAYRLFFFSREEPQMHVHVCIQTVRPISGSSRRWRPASSLA